MIRHDDTTTRRRTRRAYSVVCLESRLEARRPQAKAVEAAAARLPKGAPAPPARAARRRLCLQRQSELPPAEPSPVLWWHAWPSRAFGSPGPWPRSDPSGTRPRGLCGRRNEDAAFFRTQTKASPRTSKTTPSNALEWKAESMYTGLPANIRATTGESCMIAPSGPRGRVAACTTAALACHSAASELPFNVYRFCDFAAERLPPPAWTSRSLCATRAAFWYSNGSSRLTTANT
jgi:hypothetical protein